MCLAHECRIGFLDKLIVVVLSHEIEILLLDIVIFQLMFNPQKLRATTSSRHILSFGC